MVKECQVIINNDAVTVVRYDDIEVQLPSIKRKANRVFVKCENGIYSVVDKMEDKHDDDVVVTQKKKKKTIEEPVDETKE